MNDGRRAVLLRLLPGLAALALISAFLLASRRPAPRAAATAPGAPAQEPSGSQLAQALQRSLPMGPPAVSAWGREAPR